MLEVSKACMALAVDLNTIFSISACFGKGLATEVLLGNDVSWDSLLGDLGNETQLDHALGTLTPTQRP